MADPAIPDVPEQAGGPRPWDDYGVDAEIDGVSYTGSYRRLTGAQLKAIYSRGDRTLGDVIDNMVGVIEELAADGEPADPEHIDYFHLLRLYGSHPFFSGGRRGPGDEGDRPDGGGGGGGEPAVVASAGDGAGPGVGDESAA